MPNFLYALPEKGYFFESVLIVQTQTKSAISYVPTKYTSIYIYTANEIV